MREKTAKSSSKKDPISGWRSLQEKLAKKSKKLGIRTEEDVNRIIHEFRQEQRRQKGIV